MGRWRLAAQGAFQSRWERASYGVLVAGVLLTAIGSAYYHWRPNDRTLVWDRLPMTLAFLSLFSTTIGERVDSRLGRALLVPLLIAGIGSVWYWTVTGDPRVRARAVFADDKGFRLCCCCFRRDIPTRQGLAIGLPSAPICRVVMSFLLTDYGEAGTEMCQALS
ncbi:MAG TPA: hypothetical protein VKU19_24095 [Bryobacteraceae bacterium]|nr:hypothetical protein [Bryobacteraceae bacterium]